MTLKTCVHRQAHKQGVVYPPIFGELALKIYKMAPKSINAVVADDHKLVCVSLSALLKTIPFINHVHQAHNGQEALTIVRQHPIDVVFLDVRMPVMDGLQAADYIIKEHPSIKVISMTMYSKDDTLMDLFRLGAPGILLKENADFSHLTLAITEVMAGRKYYNMDMLRMIEQNIHKLKEPSRTHFTPRELDVLRHTCNGKAAKEIAEALTLNTATVEDYRKEMLRKTKTRNVAELVSFAHRNGLL